MTHFICESQIPEQPTAGPGIYLNAKFFIQTQMLPVKDIVTSTNPFSARNACLPDREE